MNKEEFYKLIESIPECEECKKAQVNIAYDNIILSGCNEHIVQVIEFVKKENFFKFYANMSHVNRSTEFTN